MRTLRPCASEALTLGVIPAMVSVQARRRPFLSCILCKTAGRPHNTHDLTDCRFLPERDKRPWARSHLVTDHPDIPIDEAAEPVEATDDVIVQAIRADEPSALRVSIV